ncbi:hypothetical protein GJ744_006199 [Endocarpon pusillum]|uniref:Chalcone isomerase domain-containing protein n=1 Tax=Endocarpon pusillum TaxID=364733 RepID=A0A8H7AM55_9EURO|nr:hypothetical protein GJ744_006199 [Endocarpon pusillum]
MKCVSSQTPRALRVSQFPASSARNVLTTGSCVLQTSRASFSTIHPRRNGPFITTYGSNEFLARKHRIKIDPSPSSERARLIRRSKIAGFGIIVCAVCIFGIIKSGVIPEPSKNRKRQTNSETQLDGPASIVPDTSLEDRAERVATGTSTIPTFPKTIYLSSLNASANASVVDKGQQKYQLVGLGIRTVSFLGIQVYVVGLYIAVPDIATLQERLVRKMDPVATTLVPSERQKLRELLLDPVKGEEVWDDILKDGGIRTAFRIVPTRNTDFMHLRDGWVRGITGRTQARTAAGDQSFNDETFGASVNDFKAIWGSGARKSLPKGGTLTLTRDAEGKMAAWIEEKQGSLKLGGVNDERISRLIWLGYLAGKNVSSEGARKSVVDGVMDFVERPVGTVAQQVV